MHSTLGPHWITCPSSISSVVRELSSAVSGRLGCPCVAAAPVDLTTVAPRLLHDPPVVNFASSSLCSFPLPPACDRYFHISTVALAA